MTRNFWIVIIVLIIIGFFIFNKSGNNTTTSDMNNGEEGITTAQPGDIAVTPIEHATMVLSLAGKTIYTDPVGGAEAFVGQAEPDLILVTDIHGDHLSEDTLKAVAKDKTVIIMPQAVKDAIKGELPGSLVVLKNNDRTNQAGFLIEAIPMYNLPEAADAFHVKGRGNGYVVEATGKRVYISGDTEDVPEMRALKNIDMAFIAMNLPYTMDVDQAAVGVLAFKPKRVTPYHYRGQEGLSDINKFRDLVNAGDPSIEVDIMNFYPN